MCSTVYTVSRHESNSTTLTSSSEIFASQHNIPSILSVMSAISDYKSLAIFRAIAELNNTN
jgi:hypothetical protein